MGRSQVQRNQTRGRPGTKGRGGRGAASGSSYPRRRPELESNAWRYGEDSGSGGDARASAEDPDVSTLDELLPGYSDYGPSHTEIEMGTGAGRLGGGGVDLDLTSLAAVLRGVPTSRRLGLPEHVANLYDEKFGGAAEAGRAKGVSELRLERPQISAEENFRGGEDGQELRVVPGKEALVGDGDAEQVEEDDLDAWLDDMIA